MFSQSTSPHCVNRILQALNQTSCIHSFFIITTVSEALLSQINCRHAIGMSTCPHCNEVQPCNLYIKCTLCPFIACRELKASWCFALRRSLAFWWGAAELLVAILNPNWQRQQRKGGVQLRKKPDLQAIFINLYCLERTYVSTQSNKQCESNRGELLSLWCILQNHMVEFH